MVVMSKESRLCYHAVPKIIKTNVEWISQTESGEIALDASKVEEADDERKEVLNKGRKKRRITISSDEEYNDVFVEDLWSLAIDEERWKPFADYICDCRININVRQVLHYGEQTL